MHVRSSPRPRRRPRQIDAFCTGPGCERGWPEKRAAWAGIRAAATGWLMTFCDQHRSLSWTRVAGSRSHECALRWSRTSPAYQGHVGEAWWAVGERSRSCLPVGERAYRKGCGHARRSFTWLPSTPGAGAASGVLGRHSRSARGVPALPGAARVQPGVLRGASSAKRAVPSASP